MVAKAVADATAAANARFSAVLASEHYAGRETLAQTLLGNDKLTAEESTPHWQQPRRSLSLPSLSPPLPPLTKRPATK
jgi:hypothetical protein